MDAPAGGKFREGALILNHHTQVNESISLRRLLFSPSDRAGSEVSQPRAQSTDMTKKNGAIIHVERGYQIVEVVDAASQFVGYRLLGAGAESLPGFATEEQAQYALEQLVARKPDTATE